LGPPPGQGLDEAALNRADPLEPHDAYLALRSPDYRRFALGFAPSSIGLQMMGMAVGWEIYHRTQSTMALAYAGLARALPVLLLALPAGHIADLYNRRNILVITQTCFALFAGLMAWASYTEAPIWVFYLLLLLSGAARSFNGPARSSLLPMIAPGPAFQNAVAWNSGVFQVAAIAGPLLAGAIIEWPRVRIGGGIETAEPRAWPVYIVTAVGCGMFAISAIGMRIKGLERPASNGSAFSLKAMVAGMSHVWREKTILAALSLDLFAVLLGGATALLPVYAKDILHVGAVWLGVLRASQFVGALLMSVVLAHRPVFDRAGHMLLWSVAGFGLCMIAFGISKNIWVSLVALTLSGALDAVSVVIRHVLVQTRTPDHVRGRVSAVNSVFIESSNQLGEFESGAVARLGEVFSGSRALGAVFSVVSGGIGTILVVIGIALAWPEIRKLRKL
jgi:MFS family permease